MAQGLQALLWAVVLISWAAGASPDAMSSPSEVGELMQGLAQDDACQKEDGRGIQACGLDLLQIRRSQASMSTAELGVTASSRESTRADSKSEAAASRGGGSFVPQTVGQNLWPEATWEDVLAEVSANVSFDGECDKHTMGTCTVKRCDASRGAVECMGGTCMCEEGFCAQGGICFPRPGTCLSDTGGACSFLACSRYRGDATCKDKRCHCKPGHCAWKGKCHPVRDTGGSCRLSACRESRGPTTCHKGRCLCTKNYVAVNGRCERQTVTITGSSDTRRRRSSPK